MARIQDLGSVTISRQGAPADGATDISSYMEAAAIAAAAAGGVVYVPEGTFLCSADLSEYDNIIYVGSGKTSVLKLPSGAAQGAAIIKPGSHCRFEGLTFDPNEITSSTCIRIVAQEWVSVRDCHFITPRSGGVYIDGACKQINVQGNQFQGAGYGVLTSDDSTWQDLSIVGNVFEGASDRGDAIELNTPDTGGSSASIVGNVIRDYTAAASAGFGIGVSGSKQLVIKGNVITNCREGIHVEHGGSATVGSSRTVIEGNVITTCARSGIALPAAENKSIENITVIGNQLYDCNVSAGDAALTIEDNGDKKNIIIANNIVDGGGQDGIQAACGSGAMTNVQIVGNICRNNTGMGIRVGGSGGTKDNILVQGNRCYDDQGTQTQTYGLEIVGAQTLLRVYDNDFNDNGTGPILLTSASGTIKYRANEGYVTEAQGTGTIANGATSATITHGLSYTPNRAEISITLGENPTNTPGAIWVDTIGATTFQVNSENDPGATGLDFSWLARRL